MPAVRRPGRSLVPGIALCEFDNLLCPEIQGIYIKYLVYTGNVGNPASSGRPGGCIMIASPKAYPPDI